MYDIGILDRIHNKLWGVEAVEAVEAQDACPSCDPPTEAVEAVEAVEKVEGLEEQLRKADKALNEAYTAKQAAERAITENQNPQAVYDLVQALRDADEAIVSKEMRHHRLNSFREALFEELTRLDEARNEVLAERLTAEIGIAEGEFDAFKTTWEEKKADKDTYDAEETRLREARAAMDTDGSTDAQKSDADQALSDHQATKDGIYQAEEDAKADMDNKRQQITDAATFRDEQAY